MNRFLNIFKNKLNVIGMVHLEALPGTPKYTGNFNYIIQKAKYEAFLYNNLGVDAILIENMHDIPYVQGNNVGIEIVTSMTRIARDIKYILPSNLPCGIQVLASANTQALAISKACDLQFIRTEGFIFSHIADEGWTNACAGELLRYRKSIDADSVLIFTDLKKKHSSHSITGDMDLKETAKAAEFFLTDGIIITGNSTGEAIKNSELDYIQDCKVPILIGSGCTVNNIEQYYGKCNGIIVGSHFKRNGKWNEDLDEIAIKNFIEKVNKIHC